jgi:hypothetical protein
MLCSNNTTSDFENITRKLEKIKGEIFGGKCPLAGTLIKLGISKKSFSY